MPTSQINRLVLPAAVAVTCALSATVHAQVVRSGPVDIPLLRDFTGTGLNVITGEANRVPSDRNVDINFFVLSDEWRLAQLDNFDGGGIVATEMDGPPAILEEGDVVGPGLPLRMGGGIRTGGRFDDVEGAYIGIYFENEATDTLHYGWVQVTLSSDRPGRILQYAYEATPDTPITIGDGTACRADIDGDGELTVFDFLDFQNLFAAGDLGADFDGDGELTLFDFLDFQSAFDAGC